MGGCRINHRAEGEDQKDGYRGIRGERDRGTEKWAWVMEMARMTEVSLGDRGVGIGVEKLRSRRDCRIKEGGE